MSRQAATLASVFGGEAREWYGVICSLSAEDDISQGEAARRIEMWGHECVNMEAACFRLAREEERRPTARECLQALISYQTERVMTELLVLCSFYPLPAPSAGWATEIIAASEAVTHEQACADAQAAADAVADGLYPDVSDALYAGAPPRTHRPPVTVEESARKLSEAMSEAAGTPAPGTYAAALKAAAGAPSTEAYADRGASMYRPGTYVRRARVVIDGDCDGVQWGTEWQVCLPGGEVIACFTERDFGVRAAGVAYELALLYNLAETTREDLTAWHAGLGGGR